MAERSREAGDQAGEHAELLSLCVTLQGLHPQEEEADALTADLETGAQATLTFLITAGASEVIKRLDFFFLNLAKAATGFRNHIYLSLSLALVLAQGCVKLVP